MSNFITAFITVPSDSRAPFKIAFFNYFIILFVYASNHAVDHCYKLAELAIQKIEWKTLHICRGSLKAIFAMYKFYEKTTYCKLERNREIITVNDVSSLAMHFFQLCSIPFSWATWLLIQRKNELNLNQRETSSKEQKKHKNAKLVIIH